MSQRAAFIERRMISLCGKAVHGWSMIADGDSVAVGLSGGKDSLSLVWLLVERQRRVPIDFAIKALHVEMGYGRVDLNALERFCRGLGVEFMVRRTDYGPRAHTPENKENSPCFFCAMHRRRELFQMASAAGCAKLALAHQQDDLLETFFMNLLYAGSLATMLPVQPFFGGEITLIRPLSLASAAQTRHFAEHKGFPVQPACCPSASEGQRARIREFLESFYRLNRKVRPSIWGAISASGLKTLPSLPNIQRHRRRGKRT